MDEREKLKSEKQVGWVRSRVSGGQLCHRGMVGPSGSWWAVRDLQYLVATAPVKSGNNTALEEEHFITRSLKNLEPDPLLEKPSLWKWDLQSLVGKCTGIKGKKNLRNTRQDMIKYRNYGTINTCSRSSSKGGDQWRLEWPRKASLKKCDLIWALMH